MGNAIKYGAALEKHSEENEMVYFPFTSETVGLGFQGVLGFLRKHQNLSDLIKLDKVHQKSSEVLVRVH